MHGAGALWHPSQWAAIESFAKKNGCVPQTLHIWVKQHQADSGQRYGASTAKAQRIKELEREVRELREATYKECMDYKKKNGGYCR